MNLYAYLSYFKLGITIWYHSTISLLIWGKYFMHVVKDLTPGCCIMNGCTGGLAILYFNILGIFPSLFSHLHISSGTSHVVEGKGFRHVSPQCLLLCPHGGRLAFGACIANNICHYCVLDGRSKAHSSWLLPHTRSGSLQCACISGDASQL